MLVLDGSPHAVTTYPGAALVPSPKERKGKQQNAHLYTQRTRTFI